MAPRLRQGQETSAKVIKLKPRKAKGAKSSGGRKPAARMKPPEHAAPPKRQPARPAAATPAPAIAPQPTDAEIRRATQDRLVALHGQIKPVEAKMSAAQEALSELRGKKQAIRAQIQSTCVPLAIYDEVRKRVDAKTKRADNELYEKQRALAFEAFGLPVGPAPELPLEGVPEAAKPAVYWHEVGYRAAVDGSFSDPQRDGVPPENTQDYMQGFSEGTARNAEGIKLLKQDAKKPAADKLPPASIPGGEAKAAAKEAVAAGFDPGAPGGDKTAVAVTLDGVTHIFEMWRDFPEDPDAWSEAQIAAFKKWFETLGPEDDVNIEHAGAEAWFDRLDAEAAGDTAGDPQAASEMI